MQRNHRSSSTNFAKLSNTLRHSSFCQTVLHKELVTHSAHNVFGVNAHKVATKIPRTRQSNISNVTSEIHASCSVTLNRSYKDHNFDSDHKHCAFNTLCGCDIDPTSQLAVNSTLRNRLNGIAGLLPLDAERCISCNWLGSLELLIASSPPAKLQQWPYTILRFCTRSRGHDRNQCQIPPIT